MRKFLSLLFVLVMAGAFFAACGGDDDDSTNASDDQEQADDNSGDDASSDSNSDDSTDDSTDDSDEASDDLKELLEQQSDAHIKIVYETTGDFANDGEELTIIQDGAERSAWISGDSSYYMIDGKSISCSNLDAEPECQELPEGLGDLAALGPMTFFNALGQGMLAAGDSELDGLDKENDEVAGRDAICIDWDMGALGALSGETDADAAVRICVDKETGYLLEYSGQADGEGGSFKAVEVSEPTDADFEPPATPEKSELGDLNLDELMPEDTGN